MAHRLTLGNETLLHVQRRKDVVLHVRLVRLSRNGLHELAEDHIVAVGVLKRRPGLCSRGDLFQRSHRFFKGLVGVARQRSAVSPAGGDTAGLVEQMADRDRRGGARDQACVDLKPGQIRLDGRIQTERSFGRALCRARHPECASIASAR